MTTTGLPPSRVEVLRLDVPVSEVVVTLHGEHDISTAPAVRTALGGHVACRVVLDLQHCSFIDGSVIGVLLGAQSRLRRRGGDLVIMGAHGSPALALATVAGSNGLRVHDRSGGLLASRLAPTA